MDMPGQMPQEPMNDEAQEASPMADMKDAMQMMKDCMAKMEAALVQMEPEAMAQKSMAKGFSKARGKPF